MRSIPSILLGAVVALASASLAHAESPTPPSSIATVDLAQFARVRLDDEFEQSVGIVSDQALAGLGGPSSMRCRYMLVVEGRIDTCVVTAVGAPTPASPAALAQN